MVGVILLLSSCFAPGSYPNAETYEINRSERLLDSAISNFKRNNPEFIVPRSVGLKDERDKERGYWYHVYFYYAEEDIIVSCWTRSAGKNNATFALVSINKGTIHPNWKLINQDLDRDENKEQIEKFETRILAKIKRDLKVD